MFNKAIIFAILFVNNNMYSQISLCDKLNIKDFTRQDGIQDDRTKLLTEDVESIITSYGKKCVILNRRNYATIAKENENENSVMNFGNSKNLKLETDQKVAIRAKKTLIGNINIIYYNHWICTLSIIEIEPQQTLKTFKIELKPEDLVSEEKRRHIIKKELDSIFLNDDDNVYVNSKGVNQNDKEIIEQRLKNLENDKYTKESGLISGNILNKKTAVRAVAIGKTVLILENDDPNMPIFKMRDGSNKFNIWIENEEIKVSTSIINEKGELIGELIANEWILNKDRRLDRNFDKNSLEVLDKEGEVVFQLFYDGEKANFQGTLRGKNGEGMAFVANKEGDGSSMVYLKPNVLNPYLIERMFKYPSDLHKGEKIKK